jgi:hypothetical protein
MKLEDAKKAKRSLNGRNVSGVDFVVEFAPEGNLAFKHH